MRTCPGCADLSPPSAIHCGTCGKALLPFDEMVRELARERIRRHAVRPPPRPYGLCVYCGHKCRGRTCGYHSDLPALESA